MTVAQFFGCALIAFGPPISMFALTIAKDPIRTIMLVASSFFWLLALLFSSILYTLSPSYRTPSSLELSSLSYFRNCLVSGLGFGMISGAFSLVNVLADMTGPGTIGMKGDPYNFFIASAVTSLAFIMLHVFWGILFVNAIHRRAYLQLAYVILCHMLASCITLINPLYSVTIPTVWILTILSGVLAFIVAGGSHRTIKAAIGGHPRVLQVTTSDGNTTATVNEG
ncbi:Gamma-secretase subunit Aph-1-like [Homarus americanus]|uniref:Gamma-secretase subunit Aph-1-like n=1 Tax=Homarus americanus TaxID=6706 RepID=A0A8J5MRU6_HOMAM|nr:Gamma-secretase subunit Aph-1-like [Homarus americanus]